MFAYDDAFREEFVDEDACLEFFFRCRWPSGFRCPSCGHHEYYTISSRRLPLYECTACRRQSSVTSGTVLEGTRTPFSKWLFTMKLLSDPHAEVNAVQLSKLLRVTYKTAYSMLNKIRQCLSRNDSGKLSGQVQVGLAVFGRPNPASIDIIENQIPVAVGVSINETGSPVRIAMMPVSRQHMYRNKINCIGIDIVKERFFNSEEARRDDQTVYPNASLTRRHCKLLFATFHALFKQLNDTYHGIHPNSLTKYLAEVTFRWNASYSGTNVWNRIAQACVNCSKADLAA